MALAGWTPRLSVPERALLADASIADTAQLFMCAVLAAVGGSNLLIRWRSALTTTDEETMR
jgi:hypothetical protein